MNRNPIKLLAFDADDTLWDCQSHFDRAEVIYAQLLQDYGTVEEIRSALFSVETRNMALLGYGCKAFTLSLIENAVEVSGARVSAGTIGRILNLGKGLLSIPATPLPGVEEALQQIQASKRWPMVLFTKGELQDQENKLQRSGLRHFFDDVVIVSNKTPEAYRQLCRRYGVQMSELLMVGNSFKSDIAPVLELGGSAVHIPFHAVWAHEVIEEYDHPRLRRLTSISQLPQLLAGL